jgi:glycerol-3-phosphate dehydrogenase (NAD(P)+)
VLSYQKLQMTHSQTTNFKTIAVIGGGSWATALVKILCEKDIHINWWIRQQNDIDYIKKFGHNPRYLRSADLNLSKIFLTTQLAEAIKEAELIIFAVPSAFVREVIENIGAEVLQSKIIASAIKGMISSENMIITEFLEKKMNVSPQKMCVIAGPCHAEEVAMEKQSYLTIASDNDELAKEFAETLSCRFIKATSCNDVYGVEYCAVMKNIYAIACGLAHGLNYGDNFQAVLVSNAMTEIKRFLKVVNPRKRKLNQSAYLGDLLVTTYSQFSRNRTFGNMLSRGYSIRSAQLEMGMIAEGYYAVRSIYEIGVQHNIKMPIIKAVYNSIHERISPIPEFRILAGYLK